jgi:hypothetical protein
VELAAVKIGTGVPTQPFAGGVRSVFANAAILSVADRLLALVPDAIGGLPFAITVDVPPGFNFTNFLTAGAAAVSRGDMLRFAGSVASVDLRAARPWRSRLRSISLDFASPATTGAWRTVAAALRADGRSSAIALLAPAAISSLAGATRCFDLESAGQAAAHLVGLGAGGTPAGDDLLVGYLAGVWSSIARDRRRADFAAGLGGIWRRLAKRTNDVSSAYLRAAAAGEVSERLTVVAAGIAEGAAPAAVAEAAIAALAIGHSSGADGTYGLLLGLAAWGPEPIFAAGCRLGESTLLPAGDLVPLHSDYDSLDVLG